MAKLQSYRLSLRDVVEAVTRNNGNVGGAYIESLLTFNSVKQAVLIYTSIPLAIVGGVLALFLRGLPFSISAGVGFIALFGVAVLDGVVMVSYINQLRDQGRSLEQAVREGAEARLRPILMTALVASLGFVPMAISSSAGAGKRHLRPGALEG